jgi:hypothetical protein
MARTVPAVLSCALLAGVVGCGGGDSTAVGTVTVTRTLTATATPSDAATGTPTDSPSATEPTTTESLDATADSSPEPTGPPVIRNLTAPKVLTLADIFEHEGWEEGVYQIPRSTTGQQAIGSERAGCDQRTMEVRLAEATGRAEVTVAQALDSQRSDVILQIKLEANGRLVDTKTVRFNQSTTLSTPLAGVSALTLKVEKASSSTYCQATVVITDFRIIPA